MQTLRLLHVLTRAQRRGAETFGTVLHHELMQRGETSALVALAPAPAGQEPLDVPVLGSAPRDPRTFLALSRAARSADVVVAHGSSTLLACRVALLGGHTPFVYVNIGEPLYWAASAARRRRVRWMLSGAAAVGAISPAARDQLITGLSVPSSRVVFTGNGRCSKEFVPSSHSERVAARTRFGLRVDSPTAVIVAALAPEKRVDVAIRTISLLPGWQLLVVGGGPQESSLHQLAETLAPGQVIFAGSLADVRDSYRAADVALLTSETEGLPGVLIEAALAGLPAVASDVGFVSDVVEDGQSGRLVPVSDPAATAAALSECLACATTFGERARQLAIDRYELSRVVDRWQALLHRVG